MKLRTTLPALAATLALVAAPGVAHADPPAPDRGTAWARTSIRTAAQLQGQGLAKRHLRTCSDAGAAAPAGPMAALDHMAGDWLGTGWSAGQDGISHYIQTERIRFTDDGTLDVIGTGKDPIRGRTTVFSAHAVAAWDGSRYTWVAESGGNSTVTELEVTDDGWAWELRFGPVVIRYDTTFTHNGRAWHETGAVSLDGGSTWQQTMDMTLVKTCEG